MKFKQWINESTDYIWDSHRKQLKPNSYNLGTRLDFRFTIRDDKKIVDIDNTSQVNPNLVIAMKALLSSEPRVAKYKLYLDGYTTDETVEEFINRSKEFEIPKYAYTGTSTARYDKIKIEGLKPRNITGSAPVHGAHKPSNQYLVYLSINPGNITKFAARDAASDKSIPLILQIQTEWLDGRKLMSDEDSETNNWKDSIYTTSSFAYMGTIKPEYIKPYLILKDGKWIHI